MSAGLSWFGRTLRRRITTGLVVTLVVAFALIGSATALFLHHFLLHRLDTQLTEAGDRFAVSLEHGRFEPGGGDGDDDDTVGGQSVGTLGVRLKDGHATAAAVVERDGDTRTLHLAHDDVTTLRDLPVGGEPETVHLQAFRGDYRVEAVAGRDSDVQVTGLPMHDLDETVTRLVGIEIALSATIIAATAVVVAAGVRRAMRPLRTVADTALHVSELPLTAAATVLPAASAPPNPTSEAGQVSVAFDRMLTHVRTALAARDHTEATLRQFVADASHELRTPLSTIRAWSEFAIRSDAGLSEQTAAALGRIDAAAIRMTTLVEDLLLLARLDAGRPLVRDTVDLTQLTIDAVDDARAAAARHVWQLDLPEQPIEVVGDSDRLHQVLANLLSNAAVHTPPGTTVTTRLTADADGAAVEVRDDGPGIASDRQAEVFDRFARGDAARSSSLRSSSGLGLAIAQGIVRAHAGAIVVTSEPGRTMFTVRLPT